jgi:hypothetical protein
MQNIETAVADAVDEELVRLARSALAAGLPQREFVMALLRAAVRNSPIP